MVQRSALDAGVVGAGRSGLPYARAAKRLLLAAGVALALAACQDSAFDPRARHMAPIPPATLSLMADKKMGKHDPIVIRSFKKEAEVEIWKKAADGRFALLKTFPICRWSGQLGPKVKEGDRQAPEGFYAINPAQMNPNSSYHLSFDTGYPNAFDRAHGRTGSHLMVHGACSSRGCFAMTDEAISEIYAIAREAFGGGQRTFQFQSYPFRMTPKNLAQHRHDPNMPFWQNLKEGSDYFEVMREEPKVGVCGKRYVFGGQEVAQGDCAPAPDPLVAQKREQDEQQVADLVAKGTPAIKLVYDDGGQHETFRKALVANMNPDGTLVLDERDNRRFGLVSRPEALAAGPREIVLDGPGRPKDEPTALALSPAKPEAPAQAAAFASQKSAAPNTVAEPLPQKFAEPAGAKITARAEPAAPTPAREASAEGKPLYQRMFNSIGSLIGSTSGSETAAAQPAQPVPAPPRRDAPPVKPQAAKPALERQAGVAAPMAAN
ncbi:MAG TPA: murein L,D-transpeptidase family protein [Microvirga sp.]|jgi:murein L,D-transpeptidase YafK|nr:murein L,D-transpeptidase family protein [Microvirga sp.]